MKDAAVLDHRGKAGDKVRFKAVDEGRRQADRRRDAAAK
jgi:hypothetical protein